MLVPTACAPTGEVTPEALGLLTGLVPVSISGLRPTLGAGPLLPSLAAWSDAGVACGLASLRIGQRLAEQYERQVSEGNILISVQTDLTRDVNRLKAILLQHDAADVGASGEEREALGLSGRESLPEAAAPR